MKKNERSADSFQPSDNEGPIQAHRILEEIVEDRERPMRIAIVGSPRSMGKTFMVNEALKEADLLNQAVYPMPSDNIKRPKNERIGIQIPKPFYIPTPKPLNRSNR